MAITRRIVQIDEIDNLEETKEVKEVFKREDCERHIKNAQDRKVVLDAEEAMWQDRLDEFPR